MKTLAERLNEVKKKNRLTWDGFAEKLGESPDTLRAYAGGSRNPTARFFENFKSAFGYDIEQNDDKTGTNVPHETIEVKSEGLMYEKFFAQREYIIIPKIIIDECEIIPKTEQEERRRLVAEALQANRELIEMLKAKVIEFQEIVRSGRSLKSHKTQ
jgi:transcriptional regulator with XRE-family HTH domain